jgi:hypothetical protein
MTYLGSGLRESYSGRVSLLDQTDRADQRTAQLKAEEAEADSRSCQC